MSHIDLGGASIVVTGASSGIGRATALAFARRGANVTVAARRKAALDDVSAECEAQGGHGLALACDVGDAAAVDGLAASAAERFGGIDAWVNNAGVGLFGPFEKGDLAAHKRVIETNLFGTLHGTWAALGRMRGKQRGVVVNVSSIGGLTPVPYAASYAASKSAIRAFAASLDAELRAEGSGVRIATVLPSVVDTPALELHGGNVSGRAMHQVSGPVTAAETVAEAIVGLVEHPRAELTLDWMATGARLAYAAAPETTARLTAAGMRRFLDQAPPAEATTGNLFEPVAAGTAISGGMRERALLGAPSGMAAIGAAGLAAAALLAFAVMRSRQVPVPMTHRGA